MTATGMPMSAPMATTQPASTAPMATMADSYGASSGSLALDVNQPELAMPEAMPEMAQESVTETVAEPEMAQAELKMDPVVETETTVGIDEPVAEPEAMDVAVEGMAAKEDTPFIARPALAPKQSREPEVQPDAFAEAALTNGASVQAPESKAKPTRGPSLLERMTGTGRARQKAREAESTSHEPSFGRRDQAEPGAPAPQPEIKAEPVVTPEPVAPKTSSSMPAIDPADRLAPAADDDLLDIPAFLRRQAN